MSSPIRRRSTHFRPVARLELDPHHDPSERRVENLQESRLGEDVARADMRLSPGDLLARLGDHRVGLERARTALPGKLDGGAREGSRNTAAPEPSTRGKARDRPNAGVIRVLAA